MKTRLGQDIGFDQACNIYKRLVIKTLQQLEYVNGRIRVLYNPPNSLHNIQNWLKDELSPTLYGRIEWEVQAEGDLGDKLGKGFESGFSSGAQSVTAIGTDCPNITKEDYKLVGDVIDSKKADVVIGPALDGGYYLISTNQKEARLFDDIPWSARDTLKATLELIDSQNLRVTLLDPKEDIDDVESLERNQGFFDES